MSNKRKQKQDNKLVTLNSPSLLKTAIYFSLEVEDIEHYFDILSLYYENHPIVRECLLEQKIIPKYFDTIIDDDLYDLKTLISPIYFQPNNPENDSMTLVMDKVDESKPQMIVTYAEMLANGVTTDEMVNNLVQLRKENELPTVFEVLNSPEIVDDKFCMSINEENDYELCDFDYVFPQRCVFAINLNILGNANPISKFREKLSEGIELSFEFQELMEDMLEDESVVVHGLDLLQNASDYQHDLIKAKFRQNIDEAIENSSNDIIFYDGYPLFINAEDDIDIKLPFLTFDMFCKTILSQEKTDHLDVDYYLFTLKRLNVVEILDDLGLDYEFILGQRTDFVHEPEMKNHIINKVKSRDILEGNVYFEHSDHHINPEAENEAVLATMAMANNVDYPIFILTMQSEEHIVKQVNAYLLNPEDQDEEDINLISDYFYGMGNGIQHFVEENELDISYCPSHRQLNGLFCNLNHEED